MIVTVTVTPDRRPKARLQVDGSHIGNIIMLGPYNILVETQNGRRDRFRSIESCARFCGIPMSETIELQWISGDL